MTPAEDRDSHDCFWLKNPFGLIDRYRGLGVGQRLDAWQSLLVDAIDSGLGRGVLGMDPRRPGKPFATK
jgi:hypothetical protein